MMAGTQPVRLARPPARQNGKQQHDAVAQEETRPHCPLEPWKTGAFRAAQFVVVDADEDHESDEEEADDPRAPAPEARDEKQHGPERLRNTEPNGSGKAERFRHFCLGQPHCGTHGIGNLPKPGCQEDDGHQDGGCPVGGGTPLGWCRP
jgi:hypothetical protein